MNQISIASLALMGGNQQQNAKPVNKEDNSDTSIFAMLMQGLGSQSSLQLTNQNNLLQNLSAEEQTKLLEALESQGILSKLNADGTLSITDNMGTSESTDLIDQLGNKLFAESDSTLLQEIENIFQFSNQPKQDLTNWFKSLNSDDLQKLDAFFTKLADTNPKNNFQEVQFYDTQISEDLVAEKSAQQQNINQNLNINFKQNNNENSIDEIIAKIESLVDAKSFKFDDKIADQKNIGSEAVLSNANQNTIKSETSTLMQSTKQFYFTDNRLMKDENNHQESELFVKTLDLNQLQLQSSNEKVNSILNNAKSLEKNIETLTKDKNFTNELGNIIVKNLKLPNGSTETQIQLYPKDLGKINVKLVAENGQISAQIFTETQMGKNLIEGQINQLKQSLVFQGYQVEKIEIQQVSATGSTSQNLNSGFGFSDQQSSNNANKQQKFSSAFKSYSEEIEEFNINVYNDSGIDYTA